MLPPDEALWFSEAVRPHEPALRAFLSRRFATLPDHDDLVQETYARMLRVADRQRLVHTKSFLFTTARNVAIDQCRKLRRTPVDPIEETDEAALLQEVPGAGEALDRAQRHEAMLKALGELPARCRETMLLRYVDGLSPQEIAQHLGMSPSTVRVHLMNGMRGCAQFFRAHGLLDAPAKGQP